jgi:hypothetical protein
MTLTEQIEALKARWRKFAVALFSASPTAVSPTPDPVSKSAADWSSLPKDLYVTKVVWHDQIVCDVTMCNVPMALAPEVRYSRDVSKPDLLGAEWMRAQAALVCAEMMMETDSPNAQFELKAAHDAIRAIPGATDAELDRAALDRPVVQELVAMLRVARIDLQSYVEADWPEKDRSNPMIERKYQRDMAVCRQIDAALAKIKEAGK